MKNKSKAARTACTTLQKSFAAERAGGGTREWSDVSFNIAAGCSHNCWYCYARGIARRFGRIASIDAWKTMTVDQARVAASTRDFHGVVMFPTTHDITPEILPEALETLTNLLGAGNKVLVVTKPHLRVIQSLCQELAPYRDRVQFRFTIGSLSSRTCALWEPGAPPPEERLASLGHAFSKRYQTSVSGEPMLGNNSEMVNLVQRVCPFVTDTVWLGKLNGGVPAFAQTLPGLKQSLLAIRSGQSDKNILWLYKTLAPNPKVRWKDSIKKVLRQHHLMA